ncbi:unnamed protein product [Calicophoron daubneyi]|uniref:Aquaporin n=1 Tax=Calicophoron daubneyi TaxID=300641 RepID=A0AAV2SY69_CALDB
MTMSLKREVWHEYYQRKLHRWAEPLRLTYHPLFRACLGEALGTFIFVILLLGSCAQYHLGTNQSFLSLSLGSGMAVTFGVIICMVCGYGLLNPALCLGFAIIGKVPWFDFLWVSLAEYIAAYLGALYVFAVYENQIHTVDPDLTMEKTGIIFVTRPGTTNTVGFWDQVVSTAILACVCLAMIDKNNIKIPLYLIPLYVGLLIYAITGGFCINAGAALNPARDFSPRLALLTVGYGVDCFKDMDYYFWVPIIGPYVGAVTGSILYETIIGIHVRGVANLSKKTLTESVSNSEDDSVQ